MTKSVESVGEQPVVLQVSSARRLDDLLSLRGWLVQDAELRGRVNVRRRDVDEGEMGSLADALTVGLAAGGGLTVLAQAVVAWVRSRSGELRVTLRLGEKELAIEAKNVRSLDSFELAALAEEVSTRLLSPGLVISEILPAEMEDGSSV